MGESICFAGAHQLQHSKRGSLQYFQDTSGSLPAPRPLTCSVCALVTLLDSRTCTTRVFLLDVAGSCLLWGPLAYTLWGIYDLGSSRVEKYSSSLTPRTQVSSAVCSAGVWETRLPGTGRGALGLSGVGSCSRAGDCQSQNRCPAGTSREHS